MQPDTECAIEVLICFSGLHPNVESFIRHLNGIAMVVPVFLSKGQVRSMMARKGLGDCSRQKSICFQLILTLPRILEVRMQFKLVFPGGVAVPLHSCTTDCQAPLIQQQCCAISSRGSSATPRTAVRNQEISAA